MKIINLSEENNIICQYLAELRDVNVQNDRMRFRNNVRRIGNAMAYEVSKSVRYKKTLVTTPLETTTVSVLDDDIVIGTVFRAGLPLHEPRLQQCWRAYRIHRHSRFDGKDPDACRPYACHRREHGAGLSGF